MSSMHTHTLDAAKRSPSRIRQSLGLSLLAMLGSSAFAANVTWVGNTDANFNTGTNWSTSAIPAASSTLVFGAAGTSGTTLTNGLTAGYAPAGLTFNAGAPAYTISGNSLSAAANIAIVLNSVGVTQTLNLDMTALSGTGPIITGAGDLVYGGTLTRSGGTAAMTMSGTGTLTLSGSTNLYVAATNAQLNVNSGTVILNKTVNLNIGGNAGGLFIYGGTVKQGAANQINATLVQLTGGSFDLGGFDLGSAGSTTVGMNLKGTGGIVVNNGGNSSQTNTLNVTASNATNFGLSQIGAYGGTITDGTSKLALAVTGVTAGWFEALAGNNTYSGGTKIDGGQVGRLSIASLQNIGTAGSRSLTFNGTAAALLQITGNQLTSDSGLTLTFASGKNSGFDIADSTNTFTLGTAVNSGASGVFTKNGAGTLVLTGAATYTGATNINGGTLQVNYATGSLNSATALNLTGAGTLSLLGNSTGTTTQSLASTTLSNANGGGNIVVNANGGSGTTLNLGALNGVGVSAPGLTMDIKLIGANNKVTTTSSGATNGLYGGGRLTFRDASGNIDLATNVTSGGNQTIGAATYTAGLPASGSTSSVNYSQTGNASVTTTETISALKLTTSTTGQSLAITSGQTLTTNALLFVGANDYNITGGTLAGNLGTGNSDLVIHQYGAGNLTISSVIANATGATTLTKAGTGTLILGATNTYTGQTYVNGGTLSISSDNNLTGYNGTLTGVTSSTANGNVTSTAASLPTGFVVGSAMLGRAVTAIGGGTGAYTITLSGTASNTIAAGTASWASPTAALNLNGGGVLQATSTFSLQESNAGGTGGTSTVNRVVTIGSGGGGFDVTGANVLTVPGVITATGELKKSGTGTLFLTNPNASGSQNNLTGGVRIEDGTLKLGSLGSLDYFNTLNATAYPTNALAFGAGAAPTLTLNGFSAQVLGLTSSNTAAVIQSGSATGGTDTLTVENGADNTYAGTLVNGGTRTLSLTKSGAGALTLSNVNTYTGATTINNGKLTIASGGRINGTSGVSIAGGEFNYNSSTALSQAVSFSGTGGKLSGSGTITPSVTVSSGNTLAPGNSIGTLSFGTGLTLASGSTYTVELGTPNASPASGLSDRAAVTGALALGGNLTLVDNAGANSQGSAGAGAYRIATYTTTLTGTFSGVTNPLSATLHEKVVYGAASGGGAVDLNLYRLATANTLSTPLALGNVRVGGTLSQAISVQNTASSDGFSEGLNASGGTLTGSATTSGSITNLAAGSTDSSTVTVGLSTGTAGAKTGTVVIGLASNGSGTSDYGTTALSGQTVTVNGAVYNPATADSTQTINLAITRVGSSATTSAVTLTNTGSATAPYQETLGSSSFTSTTSGFTTAGSVTGIAGSGGQGSGTLTVGIGSGKSAGAYTGTTTLGLNTEAVNGSGLGIIGAGSQVITINGQVNEYAQPAFGNAVGSATLGGSGTTYTLDFGSHAAGTTNYSVTLDLTNTQINAIYQDVLNGTFDSSSAVGAGFSFSGLTLAGNIGIGGTSSIVASFDITGKGAGNYSGNLIFNGKSINGSDLAGAALNPITIALSIDVTAVPEPSTYAAIFGALALVGTVIYRRRRVS